MPRLRMSWPALAALCLTVLIGRAAPAQTYTLTDLGTVPGAAQSFGRSVNGSGQVTGSTGLSSGQIYHAFLHNGTAISDLGTLGGSESFGAGINNAGQVVGWARTKAGYQRAVLWNRGTVTDLTGRNYSEARAINNASSPQIAGHTSGSAWVWQSGRLTSLKNLTKNGSSEAYAINDHGHVGGASGGIAVVWTSVTPTSLGVLPGGTSSTALAMNNYGQVAGVTSILVDGFQRDRATLWNSSGAPLDLGTLGGSWSRAHGINALGQVVGLARTPQEASHGFIWDAVNGMRDLNVLLDPLTPPGWEIRTAQSINDAGQITGTAWYTDASGAVNSRAFLLTPTP